MVKRKEYYENEIGIHRCDQGCECDGDMTKEARIFISAFSLRDLTLNLTSGKRTSISEYINIYYSTA